ncbi:uncharacterized protein I206_100444 [Kwoniella pini CBS 10737]|uniref:SET domain-containing protein n=1 Tax=Kwoniella pini CBS 10737 TaxID=1296096 RepID=A0AAJ8MK87_9TREE
MVKARKSSQCNISGQPGPSSTGSRGSSSATTYTTIDIEENEPHNQTKVSTLYQFLTYIFVANMVNEQLTSDEKKALSVLHQLCAFEQIFMEFFSKLDGLDIVPVRGSLVLSYDRSELFINPENGRAARRTDDATALERIIKDITQSQLDAKDNVVPRSYLLRIQDNFLAALRNPNLRLGESDIMKGQIGLFVKPKENLSRIEVLQKRNRPLNLEGIRFQLFSFPEKVTRPQDHGFLDDLSFDYKHRRVGEYNSKNYVLIGLGVARVINHHCTRSNVEWPFAPNALKFKDGHKEIGVMTSGLLLKERRSLEAGSEILAYYGDEFARLDCPAYHGSHNHRKFATFAKPTPPPIYNRQDPYANLDSASRADSIDLDGIQMEGPSSTNRKPIDALQEFFLDLENDEKDNTPKRSKRKKRKSRDNKSNYIVQDRDDDNEVEYLETRPLTETRRASPKRKRRVKSDDIVEDTEEEEIQDVISLNGSTRANPTQDEDILIPDSSIPVEQSRHRNKNAQIIDRVNELDEEIEKQLDALRDREKQFDKLIEHLIDLKEGVKRDGTVLRELRQKNRKLVNEIRRDEKGKARESVAAIQGDLKGIQTSSSAQAMMKGSNSTCSSVSCSFFSTTLASFANANK